MLNIRIEPKYIFDSNHPGCVDVITLDKNNFSYTGEWHYQGNYHSSDSESNYITFSHPITVFLDAYRKQNKKNDAYLLDMKGIVLPDDRIIKIDFASGYENHALASDLYWILEESTIPYISEWHFRGSHCS